MNKRIRHFAISTAFLLISTAIYAQYPSAQETLSKVETYYQTVNEYSLQVEYKMYRGYSGNEVTESYKGFMSKFGDISQTEILGSQILQFPEAQLVIDSKNKTLTYRKTSRDVAQKLPMDISTFLKFYEETATNIKGNILIYEMKLKNSQIPLPYNRLLIHVNKDTYEIEKQVLFFATKVPFVDESGKETLDSARMEITLKNNSIKQRVPRLNDFVVVEDRKPHLTKAYQAYTIIDQTNL